MATGFRRLTDIYQEVVWDQQDAENARELEMENPEAERHAQEQKELEAEAWYKFEFLLEESPWYLEACVRALRRERADAFGFGRHQRVAAGSAVN